MLLSPEDDETREKEGDEESLANYELVLVPLICLSHPAEHQKQSEESPPDDAIVVSGFVGALSEDGYPACCPV
jgi:hypothetical protein